MRHSLVEGKWEPGLSDIDLTVIIRDGLEIEQEYHFLDFFWKAFGKLRRRLPILSDVNVLAARQIPFWTNYTIRGYEARHWKVLYGRDIPRDSYIESPDKKMRDALNYAVTYYQWIFLPMFYKPAYKGYLAQRQLLRVADKIIRYGFQYQIDYMPEPKFCAASRDTGKVNQASPRKSRHLGDFPFIIKAGFGNYDSNFRTRRRGCKNRLADENKNQYMQSKKSFDFDLLHAQ